MPVKPQRGFTARRLVRLAPAALAAYELHSLIGSVAHAGAAVHWLSSLSLSSAAPWIILALALATGALLREAARGLVAVLAVSALLSGVLGGHGHALLSGFGAVGWATAVPAGLLAGLLVTEAFRGARWLLQRLAQPPPRPRCLRRRALLLRRRAAAWSPVPAPLLSGRSGRGPPRVALAAAV